MLYRDLWYPYGPVAPYWNALLFRIFSPSLYVLYASGMSITLAFALMLFAIGKRFVVPFVAFVTSFCFLIQALHSDLFNYILPYSYGATLGSLFGLLFLYFLLRDIRAERGPNLLIAGLWAGLTLLTKSEYGAACYATLIFYLVCRFWVHRSWRALLAHLKAVVPGLIFPLAGYGWFIWKLSLEFFIKDSFSREFYVQWSRRQGLRFIPSEVLGLILGMAAALILWFGLLWVLRHLDLSSWQRPLLWLGLVCGLIWAIYLRRGAFFPLALYYLHRYFLFPHGLFWLALAVFIGAMAQWFRAGYAATKLELVILTTYGMAIGVRVMSKVQMANYSIFYNAILYLIFFMVLCWMAKVVGRGLSEQRRTRLTILLLAIEAVGLFSYGYPWRAAPNARLSTDRGTIFVKKSEALLFPSVIQFMKEKTQQGHTVLVLPEETSLYFFSGLEAPSRWYMVHPYVLDPRWKQQAFIRQLEARGVDYILLSNRTNIEYGFRFFGLDYNRMVHQWIQDNFKVVGQFGNFSRATPAEFGMLIYERRKGSVESGALELRGRMSPVEEEMNMAMSFFPEGETFNSPGWSAGVLADWGIVGQPWVGGRLRIDRSNSEGVLFASPGIVIPGLPFQGESKIHNCSWPWGVAPGF